VLRAPAIRPRFQIDVPLPAEELLSRLVAPTRSQDAGIEGLTAGRHVEWMIPRAERHFWSPRLSLEVIDADGAEPSCRLRGLFGPRPSVWTLFAFGYGSLAFIAGIAILFGASQWWIDRTPTALWAIPICGAGALSLYAFSLFGQRLAGEEMERLRALLSETLGVTTI
jgi:hypothetical protein